MACENESGEETKLLNFHNGEVTVDDDGYDMELEEDNDEEGEEEEVIPKFELKASHEAKLRELLRNVVSVEIKLCKDGSKEFTRLLRGVSGGELLHEYVRSSSKLSEIMEAWRIRQGKTGLSYILSLISVILDHPEGKFRPNDPLRNAISRPLDKFGKFLIEEKLEDLYKELNSKEGKRQKTVLLLLAAIVRRGSGLASEVARVFDFSLPVFPKLAEYRRKRLIKRSKHSTREAFIEFAMSFLEVGNPGMLRWIIQKREMFSGILRGLGGDDEETVVYVLSTLRDRVLTPDSLVPPPLRSVLFGSVTLEQLIGIAARENEGLVAEVALKILVMACTDPANGLMPDMKRKISPLSGNPKRLLDLMKKLKLTEVKYHKDLILAIVDGKPSLGSVYLDEFPYNVEDHSSPLWYSAVSLAADLTSSVSRNLSWEFLTCDNCKALTLDSSDVQTILKCVFPRPFSRSVINKGLQHSDAVVKHATLKLLLERLKLFESFTNALSKNGLTSLKQEILNEVRTLLPDPQVLFALLNSMGSHYKSQVNSRKRVAHLENTSEQKKAQNKKFKLDVGMEDDDILVGGIMSTDDVIVPQQRHNTKEKHSDDDCGHDSNLAQISELWDTPSATMLVTNGAEMIFHCKVLEVLKIYHCALRSVMEASYDLFKIIPSDPMELPSSLLEPLLSVLLEHIDWPPKLGRSCGFLRPIYKNLPSFINILLLSSTSEIKHQAYTLAQAAMFSTGAFDADPSEIGAWFMFLPGYTGDLLGSEDKAGELYKNLCQPVVKFLCDAVSTVGNNLIKYMDVMKCHLINKKFHGDFGMSFSPLIVCVLEKCLRLLSSESGSSSLSEKTMIAMYVSNSMKYLLETQIRYQPLSSLIYEYLSEKIDINSLSAAGPDHVSCEYRPLLYVLRFIENTLHQPGGKLYVENEASSDSSSFASALDEVKRFVSGGSCREIEAVSRAFYLLVICTDPGQILQVSPLVLTISLKLYGAHLWPITQVCFLDHCLLVNISRLWPEIITRGLEMTELLKPAEFAQGKGDHKQASRLLSMFGCKSDPASLDIASIVFGTSLDRAPFHVIFPAIVINDCIELVSEVKDFLCDKLSKMEVNQLVLSLRLVLFWMHQIQSIYRKSPSDKLISLLKICCEIVEHILAQIFGEVDSDCPMDATPSSLLQHAPVVMETIFTHPAIALSFSNPVLPCNDFTGKYCGDSLEWYFLLFEQNTHAIDRHILHLLTVTCNHMKTLCTDQNSVGVINLYVDKIMKAFNVFVQQMFSLFKETFDICVGTQGITPLFPTLYAMLALMPYISPLESLEIAHWILSRTIAQDLVASGTASISPICLGFILAAYSLKQMSSFSHMPNMDVAPIDISLNGTNSRLSSIFEDIYFKAVELSIKYDFGAAYLCLFESIGVMCQHDYGADQTLLSAEMAMMIFWTPMQLISHCLHSTGKRKSKKLPKALFMLPKSKLMLLLIECSPLHMSVFGHLILNTLKHNEQSLLVDDYLMLLPAALTYYNYAVTKFGTEYANEYECIPSFYGSFIVDGWRKNMFNPVFEVEFRDNTPSTTVEFLNLMSDSLLGKTVWMLKNYFASAGTTIKDRSVLFEIICPMDGGPDEVLCFNIKEMQCYSGNQLLNAMNRAVAQISLCEAILFPDGSQLQFQSPGDDQNLSKSDIKVLPRLRFLNVLVSAWKLIVTHSSPDSRKSSDTSIKNSYLKFLEEHLLNNVADLTAKMCTSLVQLDSLPFLKKILKLSLLHRFNDPYTLRTFRHILCSLSQGNWPAGLFLQLLLGHSQLASTLRNVSDLSNSVVAGMFLKPIPSILRSVVITSRTNSNTGKLKGNETQLEVIKLLRILFHLCARQRTTTSDSDIGVNSKELLFLLMSSYGASMSETDLEIYGLMQEIESADNSSSGCLSELEYLWGGAAVRFRKQMEQDGSISISDSDEMKVDRRRSLFRDNLPIDPKICVATVLNFPYHRTESEDALSSSKFFEDNNGESAELEQVERYDPAFLLRFSIHCLSVGYMDVVEFSGMGLLAIALVSISSPKEGVRKLGYEVLGRFRDSLEKFQKKREVMRLRLLLTFLQNGIEEQWQKIPSISAIFAAEASVSLLDPSHEHYLAMSKLFMQFSNVKVKSIPLLEECILGNGVNFRADRFWMLRLLYTGVNMEDDALIFLKKSTHHKKRIFLNNSILELLMTLHASPLTDTGSKELILEILKKSVKLEKIALHLVKHCGLMLWLSSILSSFMSLGRDKDPHSLKELQTLLEVAHEAVSSASGKDWLKNHGNEQLLDLSSHLFRILVSRSKLVHQNASLVNMMLRVLLAAMEISHEREIYQPHFSLSLGAICQLYGSITSCPNLTSSIGAGLGLRVMLLNMPPTTILDMGHEEVSRFLSWAVSTSLKSESRHMPGHVSHCSAVSPASAGAESLESKLLRWLVASVIGRRMSPNKQKFSSSHVTGTSNIGSLLSLMNFFQISKQNNTRSVSQSEASLAAVIFHLQQLLGMKCRAYLPSVAAALSMLLAHDSSSCHNGSSDPNFFHGSEISSLWSKIRCPVESHPAWRWSFHQPWMDPGTVRTKLEYMDELHACEAVLLILSGSLQKRPPSSQILSYRELEECGIFKWERDILQSKGTT